MKQMAIIHYWVLANDKCSKDDILISMNMFVMFDMGIAASLVIDMSAFA